MPSGIFERTKEHNKSISESKRGIPRPGWVKEKISEKLKGREVWNKGKTNIYSEATLRKMSETQKNNPKLIKFKKGHECSEEIREKIRMKKIGISWGKHTEEMKMKMREMKEGENHWNWKGGITHERMAIYHTPEYRNWRWIVFERDNYTCLMCQRNNQLNAHHILPRKEYPEKAFDPENGLTLCEDCHKIWHRKKMWLSFQILRKETYCLGEMR